MNINFNKKLYNKRAIGKAIDDYSQFAKFNINEDSDNFVVNIENVKKEVESAMKDEFCNYVLGLMK